MKTIAAIPTKNKIEWTAPLIEHLLLAEQLDEVWLYDNGSTDVTAEWIKNRIFLDNRLKYFDAHDMRLYDMWNDMILRASKMDNQVNLAILNNDIRLPHNSIATMSSLMRKGKYQLVAIDPCRPAIFTKTINIYAGENTVPNPIDPYVEKMGPKNRIGWAFVVAAEWWKDQQYAIHPDYIIWYGDNDLYWRTHQRKGKIGWVRGIGCDHAMEQSDSEYPEKWEHAAIDANTFKKMWPKA